ncbi:protein phosphatase 1 regulatory subunit 42-like [Lytechinus variegatus]|uniref:protein phosphatase 1 regulatory subunit 42-like n=1 Tax=Lytechinus variegatus TaxID=7654 RepID=UPI001BB19953|nr:protein phosphatase 1 regulatory subunit 42-like [Lytechinus variegatus]
MVKLTIDLIARSSANARKKKDEGLSTYLKKLTHLYFSEKNIDEIDDLSQCRSLSVLYLYDNNISVIKNLGFAGNLTHLYLQNNQITRLENLTPLHKLSKLYVGGNRIAVLEGLEKLQELKELHMEHQRLPTGERLLFEPRTLVALSMGLQVLNVSGNNLEDISELGILRSIMQFVASDNKLRDMRALSALISSWPKIWRLELVGNPICNKAKYRDRVIVMNTKLAVLDGREVSETEKNFLLSWKEAKDAKKRQRIEEANRIMESSQENIMQSQRELPPVLPPNGSRWNRAAAPNKVYMMPGMVGGKKKFDAVLAKSHIPASAPQGTRTNPLDNLTLGRKSLTDLERPARSMPIPPQAPVFLPDEPTMNGLPNGELDFNLTGHVISIT